MPRKPTTISQNGDVNVRRQEATERTHFLWNVWRLGEQAGREAVEEEVPYAEDLAYIRERNRRISQQWEETVTRMEVEARVAEEV